MKKQKGMGFLGLIFTLGVIAILALLVLKLTPVYIEYFKVKKAVATSVRGATSPQEVRSTFDKQADVDYFDVISGRDLQVAGSASSLSASFAYDKKIPLFANISLYIEFEGSSSAAGGSSF